MRRRPVHLQLRVVARKPAHVEDIFGDSDAMYLEPTHGQGHVVSDAHHERVNVLAQTHRARVALLTRVPIGLGIHRDGKKTQVSHHSYV